MAVSPSEGDIVLRTENGECLIDVKNSRKLFFEIRPDDLQKAIRALLRNRKIRCLIFLAPRYWAAETQRWL